MRPAKLKLADYNKPLTRAPDALYFERRHAPRRRLRGQVTAMVYQPQRHQIQRLQMRDQSDTGLGAWSDEPIDLGRSITVYFAPHGPEGGFDLTGTVVRCRPCDGGYDLGIALRQRLAA